MYKLKSTEFFRKKFKKLSKKNSMLETQVSNTLKKLQGDPFYSSLGSHKIVTRFNE